MKKLLSSLKFFQRLSYSDGYVYYKGIHKNVLDLIGRTPCVYLNRLPKEENLECEFVAKLEFMNPGGSVKDRIALEMIRDAERDGVIKPDTTIIEATSGNTGVGLSLISAVDGYELIVTMPEKMSQAKENVIKSLGCTVVRTPNVDSEDPESNFKKAEQLNEEIENSMVIGQFDNPSNPKAHYENTGVEILEQCDGKIDMFVFASGTGGTITGCAKVIKEHIPDCIVVSADPVGSLLFEPEKTLNYDVERDHVDDLYHVEGIGYDFVPEIMDRSLIDYYYKTQDPESFAVASRLISGEGLLCGGSSGAITYAAFETAKILGLGKDDRVVVILPDSIRNYIYKFISDEWLKEHGLD